MKKAIIFISAMLLSLSSFAQRFVGDVNKDGTVNISDVTKLVDYILKGNAQIEYEYVDLGLSVMWATSNIGAGKPEDCGNYYAWGETAPKASYTWGNYFDTKNGGETFSIYRYVQSTKPTAVPTLRTMHDAAYSATGGEGRMPTMEEWNELFEKCSRSYTTINGSYCIKFKGPNGNVLYLPWNGAYDAGTLVGKGTQYCYWSSVLDRFTTSNKNALMFTSMSKPSQPKYYGAGVRAVKDISNEGKVLMDSLYFHKKGTYLKPGEQDKLPYTYSPVNANRTAVVWSSSNTSVATVSSDGIVTAVADGTCTITATAAEGETKGTYTVRVVQQMAGHDWVDLGLSVMWATVNFGAEKPEDYGKYIAWGESGDKKNYTLDTYVFWTKDEFSNSKYMYRYGLTDLQYILSKDDDIVRDEWGGVTSVWRMPTYSEISELYRCTFIETVLNGVAGFKVVGPNGNSMFLPAAGYKSGTTLNNEGISCYLWSTERTGVNSGMGTDANAFKWSINQPSYVISDIARYYGLPIRAVFTNY